MVRGTTSAAIITAIFLGLLWSPGWWGHHLSVCFPTWPGSPSPPSWGPWSSGILSSSLEVEEQRQDRREGKSEPGALRDRTGEKESQSLEPSETTGSNTMATKSAERSQKPQAANQRQAWTGAQAPRPSQGVAFACAEPNLKCSLDGRLGKGRFSSVLNYT